MKLKILILMIVLTAQNMVGITVIRESMNFRVWHEDFMPIAVEVKDGVSWSYTSL